MSTILTARYHRDGASSDITTGRTNNNNDGILSPSRHGVFLTDLDQSKQTNFGQYFGAIPSNQNRVLSQVWISIEKILWKIVQIFIEKMDPSCFVNIGKWLMFN